MVRFVSRVVLVALALCASSIRSVSAQTGGHSHIAPLAPGVVLPANRHSPLFNWPNGIWDYGEGVPLDTGGVISQSNPNLLSATDLVQLKAWGPVTGTNLQNYIGELRPPGTPTILTFAEATFEITAPAGGFPNATKRQHIVLLLNTRQTSGSERVVDRPYGPHIYPGDPTNFGNWEGPFPGTILVEEFAAMPSSTAPFYVVVGHIVPRTSHQPLVFSVRRLRELRRIAEIVVNQHFYAAGSAPTYTACVAGTSFGGLTTQVALALWPDEFHSGVSFAFHGSLRAVPNDQNLYNFLIGGLGFAGSGAGYTQRSAIDWSIFNRIEGVDFLSLSMLNRAFTTGPAPALVPGIRRPMVFLCADEDPVTHSQDWLRAFAGTNGHEQPYNARRTFTEGGHSWNVDVVVMGKACHGGEQGALAEGFAFPGQTTFTKDLQEPVRRMIQQSYAQRTRVVTPGSALRQLPQSTELLAVDPSDKVFLRPGNRAVANPGSLLVEATGAQGWHRYGGSTWAGIGESLKVRKLDSDPFASIFVGGTDGVISRYQLNATVAAPDQPLELQARSSSLGYGVYALDVGDFDPGRAGLEVVAAAYRRIGIYDAATLNLISTFDLPDWEHTEPMRLQIAELYGNNTTREIVLRTLHGRIVVLGGGSGGSLTILGEHSEAGVHDLLVGPQVPGGTIPGSNFQNGIWLLSARGHVAAIALDSGAADPKNMGLLVAASTLQYGGLQDLEATAAGIVALATGGPSEFGSIRVFNPSNLALVSQFGRVHQPTIYDEFHGGEVELDMPHPISDPCLAVTAQGKYVTLYGGHLATWEHGNGIATGLKNLGSFQPSLGACAMEVGDIDGDSIDEIVVSTYSGRVVWFEVDEIEAPGTTLQGVVARSVRVTGTSPHVKVHDHRANGAISATWGFALRPGTAPELHAIDPAGGWWVIDPMNGIPVLASRPGLVVELPLAGVRGLAFGGVGASALPVASQFGANDTYWRVENDLPWLPARTLTTTPYVPFQNPDHTITWQHVPTPHSSLCWDNFWIFAKGGDARQDGTHWRAAWWSNGFPNLVQQFVYDLQTNPGAGVSLWSTTKTGAGGPPAGPLAPGLSGAAAGTSLRTSTRYAEVMDMQTVRIGRVVPGQTVMQTVVSSMGGRAIVLSGVDGTILAQSDDLGLGGMAMALADLDGDGVEEIVFATAIAPIDVSPPVAPGPGGPAHGGWLRSYIHVLKFNASTSRLDRISSAPIGDPYGPDALHGFGACGIAIADLNETGAPNPTPEILVTTLNGEFVVFAQSSGVLTQTPLYRTVVEGQLGAFNSIVVADLDPLFFDNKPEVYIASSLGVRKFYVQ